MSRKTDERRKARRQAKREGACVGKSHSRPQVSLPFWSKSKIASAQLAQPTCSFRDAFVITIELRFVNVPSSIPAFFSSGGGSCFPLRKKHERGIEVNVYGHLQRIEFIGVNKIVGSSGRQIPQALKAQATPNMPHHCPQSLPCLCSGPPLYVSWLHAPALWPHSRVWTSE